VVSRKRSGAVSKLRPVAVSEAAHDLTSLPMRTYNRGLQLTQVEQFPEVVPAVEARSDPVIIAQSWLARGHGGVHLDELHHRNGFNVGKAVKRGHFVGEVLVQ
jgi:hypothetical protein